MTIQISIKFYFFLIFAVISCSNQTDVSNKDSASSESDFFSSEGEVKAHKFKIDTIGPFYILTVNSPWQFADKASFSYLLGPEGVVIPDSLCNMPFFEVPVRNVVIMSTTYISFLDTIGEINSITGISGGKLVYNEALTQRIKKGLVREVGFEGQFNYETLIQLNPDVVFLFGVESGITGTMKKLEELDIPVVLCADYLEPHPLGRLSWLEFFAAFYNKNQLARKIINETSFRYDSISSIADKMPNTPDVLLGLPWKDTWFVAGGKSFAASFIEDANGKYLFAEQDHAEARPIDIEAVYSKALEADIWINPGIATDLESILNIDPRFSQLTVFQRKNIYNNNKRVGIGGGNDYWESGILYPDRILGDLTTIFHESIPDDKELYYYKRLK